MKLERYSAEEIPTLGRRLRIGFQVREPGAKKHTSPPPLPPEVKLVRRPSTGLTRLCPLPGVPDPAAAAFLIQPPVQVKPLEDKLGG